MATLNVELFERLQNAIEGDVEMKISVARFMDCTILFVDDDQKFLLKFENGLLASIDDNAHLTAAWDFAFRAPDHTWAKFLSETPPPEFNDLWAAWFMGHLTIEGNFLAFMQNHYAVWLAMRLLRAQNSAVAV